MCESRHRYEHTTDGGEEETGQQKEIGDLEELGILLRREGWWIITLGRCAGIFGREKQANNRLKTPHSFGACVVRLAGQAEQPKKAPKKHVLLLSTASRFQYDNLISSNSHPTTT
jgi:hypothetical protein